MKVALTESERLEVRRSTKDGQLSQTTRMKAAIGCDVRPLRSASLNLSSQGMGTKTQFSGLGFTPTGDLQQDTPFRPGMSVETKRSALTQHMPERPPSGPPQHQCSMLDELLGVVRSLASRSFE